MRGRCLPQPVLPPLLPTSTTPQAATESRRPSAHLHLGEPQGLVAAEVVPHHVLGAAGDVGPVQPVQVGVQAGVVPPAPPAHLGAVAHVGVVVLVQGGEGLAVVGLQGIPCSGNASLASDRLPFGGHAREQVQ